MKYPYRSILDAEYIICAVDKILLQWLLYGVAWFGITSDG